MRRETEILALNAYDRHAAEALGKAGRAAVARRMRSFGADTVMFYRQPIEMVEAQGAIMVAADGRRYLDAYNNVPSVGHCHPHVVEAIARQAARLNTHTRYLSEVVDAYAERLLSTMPAGIDNLVLTCTGSEANDLALRMASAATGGTGFVVSSMAYHGNTTAVAAISPSSHPGRALAPHVRSVAPPDIYRHPVKDPGKRLAVAVDRAIATLARRGVRFAGLIVDSVFSSDGIFCKPPGLLQPVIERVRAAGGLFIADEVQPGFGRTGTSLWGFGHHGIEPDIVTMGKPMGNGFPMGGVATRPAILEAFTRGEKYFNTFGGNPVAAAAGQAVLDVIEQEGLIANADRVGRHLREGLSDLMTANTMIGDVRGAGLFTGLELVTDGEGERVDKGREPAPQLAAALIEGLREEGILVGAAGPFGNILKIRPPLCFSNDDADRFVEGCRTVLRRLSRNRPGKATALRRQIRA